MNRRLLHLPRGIVLLSNVRLGVEGSLKLHLLEDSKASNDGVEQNTLYLLTSTVCSLNLRPHGTLHVPGARLGPKSEEGPLYLAGYHLGDESNHTLLDTGLELTLPHHEGGGAEHDDG